MAVAGLGLALGGVGCRAAAPDRPNLLVFVVDTLRADAVGCYGNLHAETPHVDRLAREGTLFEQAFSTSSWTRPAVASILTGLHPNRHRVESRRDALPGAVRTLPGYLANAGYETGLVSANPQIGSFFGFTRGFDASFELYGRRRAGPIRGSELVARGDEVAARSLAWLASADRPFALFVLAIDPHAPYTARPPLRSSEASARARYQSEVRAADAALGEILRSLESAGELDRTAIAFTSDHGEEFGEYGRTGHGASLVDEVIHVPLVVRAPGTAPAGARISDPVQPIDIVPTLIALARLEVPPDLDGHDLLAPRSEARTVVSRVVTPRGPLHAARAYPWKLVVGPEPGDRALFDLRHGERAPVDLALDAEARAADAALSEALASSPRARAAASGAAPVHPLPDGLRAALAALGYAGDFESAPDPTDD